MGNFFKDLGRAFREGGELARNDVKQELTPAQLMFNQLWDAMEDSLVSDQYVIKKYFDFLVKFPEQKALEKTTDFLREMMARRPGTVELLQQKLNQHEPE